MGKKTKISRTFLRWLVVCIVVAFIAMTLILWLLQTKLSEENARQMLQINLEDVENAINDESDAHLLEIAKFLAFDVETIGIDNLNAEAFNKLMKSYNVAEISYINKEGIITHSSNPDFVGFDMASGEQSAEFLPILSGATCYVQKYQPITYDASIYRKYAGYIINTGGFVQVGYDAAQFRNEIVNQLKNVIQNRHVGENGYILVCDENGKLLCNSKNNYSSTSTLGFNKADYFKEEYQTFNVKIEDKDFIGMYGEAEGCFIVTLMPRDEIVLTRNISLTMTVAMELMVVVILIFLIYMLINKSVVRNINRINKSLAEISKGNLDEAVDVRVNEEFNELSDGINATVGSLKHYIEEAAARIDKELEFASTIQNSALPNVFPPFPHRKDFDIYAHMDTAKEVGGDFYDFYLMGEDKLAILIADVSGKGIPAALFMMTSKTLLKSMTESNMELNEVFTKANTELCENNDAGMFVTAWMGVLDTKTGLIKYVNAGHNPPALYRKGGKFEFLKSRPGFVLAGMEGIGYRLNEIQLYPGDTLFLYTDGVTEATDAGNNLYGDDRLIETLNKSIKAGANGEEEVALNTRQLSESVKADVDEFVGDAPQFDDITMLALKITGESGVKSKEVTLEAKVENITVITQIVDEMLEEVDCPMKTQAQVDIAIDEIFGNIAKYSYKDILKDPTEGKINVRIETVKAPPIVSITFVDDGIAYDPLKKLDPDVTLSAEERSIGGLGIFMVKKSMDEMTYNYRDSKNVLKIVKRLDA